VPPKGKIPLCFQLAFIDQCLNATRDGVLAGFDRVVVAYREHFPDDQRDLAPLPGGSRKESDHRWTDRKRKS
jgi:hypothetical protein